MPFVGLGVGVGRQRLGVGGGGFDADYQAVLNYATTQGYTLPSSGQQTLQNQLVLDLKTAGVWSKLDTFGVFATDGDEDFSLIDWIRLTDYTAVNSPTFTTNQGFTGDGTSAYINLNFDPSTQGINYQLDDASFGIGGDLSTSAPVIATSQARGCMRSNVSSFNGINSTLNVSPSFGFANTTELRVHDRDSSSQYRRIEGGVVFDTVPQPSTALPTQIFVMRDLFGYTSNSDETKYAFAGASLYNERVDFSNAINTYITSL